MGLLDRLIATVRSGLNEALGEAEDPERLLEKTVATMQENLLQLRQAVAVAIATQKRSERQHQQAETKAREYYSRAQMALAKGSESLAREALDRRQKYLETAHSLGTQLEQQQQILGQLRQELHRLEIKIAQARTQKDMYVARARSAKASQQLSEMMTQMGDSPFEQAENQILALEAQAAAAAELSQLQDPLEKKFAALESPEDRVNAELAAIKAKLRRSRPPQS